MEQNITDIDFSKGDGIVPVIVQDANTKEILTLAYSNKDSLERTLDTGTLGSGADPERSYGWKVKNQETHRKLERF